MRIALIFNPSSGTAERIAQFLVRLPAGLRCDLHPTGGTGDAGRLAAAARDEGAERIIVAGGDGTLGEVIAGIAPSFDEVELAILPLGTGNDLARALGLAPDRIEHACSVALSDRLAAIDLIRISGSQTGYCVNAANGGAGGIVAADVNSAAKRSWGAMAYWMTAMSGIGDLQHYQVSLELDDDRFVDSVLGVAASNGRFVGGGFPVAPRALLDDGMMDVTVIPALPMLELMAAGINLTLTRDQLDDHLRYYRTSRLELRSSPEMPFSIDGEPKRNLTTDDCVIFEVQARALRIAVGDTPLGLTAIDS